MFLLLHGWWAATPIITVANVDLSYITVSSFSAATLDKGILQYGVFYW